MQDDQRRKNDLLRLNQQSPQREKKTHFTNASLCKVKKKNLNLIEVTSCRVEGKISVTIFSPRIKIKDANRSSFPPTNRKDSNGRSLGWAVVWICFGPVSPAQSERHYGCFMLACRIPLKRLMPGSLSQPRTCYPPAACSDLVNEFISSVATAASASPPSDTQPVSFCRVEVISECKLSAVAPAKQVYSIMTATLPHGWRVGACMWDLFFSTSGRHQTFSKMSTFQELCKTDFEENPWTQKSPQPE